MFQGEAGPTIGGRLNPLHLPCSVYAYGMDGVARKGPVRRNPNIMGYPFPKGTRAVSLLISIPCLFSFAFL